MNINIQTINVNLTAIISDEAISDVPCNGCTLCCQKLVPFLSPDELNSGKYPISLVNSNDNNDPTITLFKNKHGGCSLLIDNKCSIYEDRPLACRQFDCRKHNHLLIPNMFEKQN